MRINHNISALNAYRQLTINNSSMQKSLEKLSSGFRINRAGDDAAGLAISEKMRGQIRGLEQASRNAQDAISLIQTAEGALNETHSILQRMRELAVQAANDTATVDDRVKIQSEVDQLAKEITRISNTTEFNTKNLMAGGLNNTFHIGANEGQNISLAIKAMDASTLGVARDVHIAALDSNSYGLKEATLDPTSTIPLGTGKITAADVSSATSGSVTGSGAASKAGAGSLQLKIDGTTVTVNFDGTETDLAAQVTAINTAANSALGTTGQTYASLDGSNVLTITSLTTGSSSTVEVLNSSTVSVLSSLKLTAGQTGTGKDAGTIDVTFTDSASNATTVNIKANASTIDFGNGLVITKDVSANNAALLANGSTGVAITIQNDTSYAAVLNSDGSVSKEAYVAGGINVLDQKSASSAITVIDKAIKTVSEERSKLGAYQNRLEHTINNLGTASENLTAAESRIRDVDMAKEMMEFTKQNILNQAATAMLAQANMLPQSVLKLLG
jgi:flagellin